MALDADELSIWDIGFRWAGHDPDRYWLRLPLLVRDNFRVLMNAVLNGEIICQTLCLDKLPSGSKAEPKFYIRTHLDAVYDCIHGSRFDRKLLRWALLERRDFLTWCSCRGISAPEFWFPPGWKYGYEHPEELWPGLCVRHVEPDGDNTTVHLSYDWPDRAAPDGVEATVRQSDDVEPLSLRGNQAAKIACQQIARAIWQKEPTRRIADVIRDELIQEYGGAKHYVDDTVRGWISVVAPQGVRENRGRPRKKNSASEQPASDPQT